MKNKKAKIILIADSDPDSLELAAFRVKEAGYKVLTAINGKEAFAIAEKTKPDLIILNAKLTVIDGVRVAKKLQLDTALKKIPLIFLVEAGAEKILQGASADEYLPKPYEKTVLLDKIERLLCPHDKKTILIVEDETDLAKLLSIRFKKIGYDVLLAQDGEEGLKKVRQEKIDLIILDLMLPKISGEEVCKQIRKDPRTDWIPIIMLTAKGTDTDRIVGRVIGADSYIPKPFDADILLGEINRLLKPKKCPL